MVLAAEVLHAMLESALMLTAEIALKIMTDDNHLGVFAGAGKNLAERERVKVLRFVHDENGLAVAADVGTAQIRIRDGGYKGEPLLVVCHRRIANGLFRHFVCGDERLIKRFKVHAALLGDGAGQVSLRIRDRMHDIHDVIKQTVLAKENGGAYRDGCFTGTCSGIHEDDAIVRRPDGIGEFKLILVQLEAKERMMIQILRGV